MKIDYRVGVPRQAIVAHPSLQKLKKKKKENEITLDIFVVFFFFQHKPNTILFQPTRLLFFSLRAENLLSSMAVKIVRAYPPATRAEHPAADTIRKLKDTFLFSFFLCLHVVLRNNCGYRKAENTNNRTKVPRERERERVEALGKEESEPQSIRFKRRRARRETLPRKRSRRANEFEERLRSGDLACPSVKDAQWPRPLVPLASSMRDRLKTLASALGRVQKGASLLVITPKMPFFRFTRAVSISPKSLGQTFRSRKRKKKTTQLHGVQGTRLRKGCTRCHCDARAARESGRPGRSVVPEQPRFHPNGTRGGGHSGWE